MLLSTLRYFYTFDIPNHMLSAMHPYFWPTIDQIDLQKRDTHTDRQTHQDLNDQLIKVAQWMYRLRVGMWIWVKRKAKIVQANPTKTYYFHICRSQYQRKSEHYPMLASFEKPLNYTDTGNHCDFSYPFHRLP